MIYLKKNLNQQTLFFLLKKFSLIRDYGLDFTDYLFANSTIYKARKQNLYLTFIVNVKFTQLLLTLVNF